ncbi:MAG: hypothetical protein ACRD43_09135 [Pyrinomonadaceae bacterium]
MKIFLMLAIFMVSTVAVHAQQTVYGPVIVENLYSSEKVVKNAPFSADAVNESIQILGDGNRIIRRSASRLYRDGEGRYRREDMPKQLGIPGVVVDVPQSIFILDPVGGFRYTLDPKTNTVRKIIFRSAVEYKLKYEQDGKLKGELLKVYTAQAGQNNKELSEEDKAKVEKTAQEAAILAEKGKVIAAQGKVLAVRSEELAGALGRGANGGVTIIAPYAFSSKYEVKNESLGVQNIEGVDAEGTRSTTTIPVGAIGNERAIDIVYEKWYSKDLQMIVLSKHNDPRIGEQTYRLTDIRREEPSPNLFSLPADYKIVETATPRPQVMNMPRPATVKMATPTSVTVLPATAPKRPNEQ